MLKHRYDKLRFRYEYNNESIELLCAEYGYLIPEVEQYSKDNNWTIQDDPDYTNDVEVNEYYSNIRRKLTTLNAKRAILKWCELIELEDDIIKEASKTIKALKDLEVSTKSLELTRLIKVLQVCLTNNLLYSEVVNVPSIADKQIKQLLKEHTPTDINALFALLKDRGIPVPDIGIEDIK